MVEVIISVVGAAAAGVTECLLQQITRPFGYLFDYRRNIADVNQKIHSLDCARERLRIPVEEAHRRGDEIFSDVRDWLTFADGIIQNRDEEIASKISCFYFKSRYRLSKEAKRDARKIAAKIDEARAFGDRVSYPPPPNSVVPFITPSSFKDYEALESRDSTFNQIMEVLRKGDIRTVGVWGMGGVGKTTLVKQVAKQAEEEKLFHKVIIVLDITEKPDILEVQARIASQLGSKFEENELDRASRLRLMLKRMERVLVILDDIWGKVELGKLGIPYDDHKGCKMLLTSRKLPVLKDMGTQKQFCLKHLNESEAWNLFTKIASCDSLKVEVLLPPVAVDVAKECAGLPVAIVTVAKALRGEEDAAVWRNALEELKTYAPVDVEGVNEKVYSCLQLSYNHLKSEEAKSLFLLCSLVGDGDISMDRLLRCALGLNLFEGLYSWEKAADRLITLVKNLKVSSLLLDKEEDHMDRSLFFNDAFVRMHDVVRDVARSIASKAPHRFVVKDAVQLREWQRTDEFRNCSRFSLMCKTNTKEQLAQGLVCPNQLEFFLLNSSIDDDYREYLNIPNDFFQETKQLRVLDLYRVSFEPSSGSLYFLSNLQTLCLSKCWIKDIAAIGKLRRLQILSLAGSYITQLPKEMKQLSDLRVLDLGNCNHLQVIAPNVISSLSQLEYLNMKGCCNIIWDLEGSKTGERYYNTACLSELKQLSGLRSLEVYVEVSDLCSLREDDVVFDSLNLNRYSIEIRPPASFWMPIDEYKTSRRLVLDNVEVLRW